MEFSDDVLKFNDMNIPFLCNYYNLLIYEPNKIILIEISCEF